MSFAVAFPMSHRYIEKFSRPYTTCDDITTVTANKKSTWIFCILNIFILISGGNKYCYSHYCSCQSLWHQICEFSLCSIIFLVNSNRFLLSNKPNATISYQFSTYYPSPGPCISHPDDCNTSYLGSPLLLLKSDRVTLC